LCTGSAESETDAKLVQTCQSAPTPLSSGAAERCSTRDAGQQTSDIQLMPCAAIAETVWTLSEPDAAAALTTAVDAECPCTSTDDEEQAANEVQSPHPTEPATPAATESLDKFSMEVQLSTTNADSDRADQHSKGTTTEYQMDNDQTLVAALNTQLTTDKYEDWFTSTTTAKQVRTTLKLS